MGSLAGFANKSEFYMLCDKKDSIFQSIMIFLQPVVGF